MRMYLALAAVASLTLAVAPAGAQTTFTGSDNGSPVGGPQPLSDAAATAFLVSANSYGPVFTLDFEGEPVGYSTNYAFPGVNVTLTGTNFGSGFSGISNTTSGNLYGYDIDTGTGQWLGFPGGDATWAFASPTNSFGFYSTGTQTTFGLTFTVSIDGAGAQVFNLTPNVNGGAQYFGVTSASAFNQVVISRPGGDAWGIDRVSYNFAQNAAVPEPGTWAMMLLGFGAIGFAVRRRRPSRLAIA